MIEKAKADWSGDIMRQLEKLTPEQFEDTLEEMKKYTDMAGAVSVKERGGASFQSLKRGTDRETTL